MKRLIAMLLLAAALLCGCRSGEQWSVENYILSDDGSTYSVCYRHDDGTQEQIVELGDYPQPLAIHNGRLYYVHGGSLVALELKDPTQKQSLTEPGLAGLAIGWMDEEAVYCPLLTDTEKCYRITLDLSDCQRITIPREDRPTDYTALLEQLCQAVGAIDDRIAVQTLRARYSETGSLTSMELSLLALEEETPSLNSWADVQVTVTRSGSGFSVTAEDRHRPLPIDSITVAQMLSLQELMTTLDGMDRSDLWSSRKQGQPLYYVLTCQAEEYESRLTGDLPCLYPDGTEARLEKGDIPLVLAQCYSRGDSGVLFQDSLGQSVGELCLILPQGE